MNEKYWCLNIIDELWIAIANDIKDSICSSCIEKRLGRQINDDDFKNIKTPCNQFFKIINSPVALEAEKS